MSIGQRLVVTFVLIALLPLGLMLGIGIVTSKNLLEETAGHNFELVALEKARAIDLIITSKIQEARTLAQHPVVRTQVAKSNAIFDTQPHAAISASIAETDLRWIEQRAQCECAQKILHNPLSSFLIKHLKDHPKGYGEIFVTGQYGSVVGMTKVLSDFNQNDEQWWQAAYNRGQGAVFIDDRGYDESVQSIVTGVVVPIEQDGHVLGVLKINFRLDDIVEIVSGTDLSPGEGIFLARSQGSVIITSQGWDEGIAYDDVLNHAVLYGGSGWRQNTHGDMDTIIGYAPVQAEIYARVLTPEARPGISGEQWNPTTWFIFIETELTPAFGSIDKLILIFALAGLAALVIVIGAALLTARTLSQPILALQKGAEDVTNGHLDRRVGTNAKDEIGQLSRSFDTMLERLNTITASRDDLNNEIYVRKLAERALDTARTEAEAANKAKSRFLANVSHDLRTPLNAIIGFAEMIRSQIYGPVGDERYKEYATDISNSGRFLVDMINDILDLSKVEAGKYELNDRELDFANLIQSSYKLVEKQIAESSITVEFDIDDDLPHLLGDERALTQTLNNLLSNATKFTPTHGLITVLATTNSEGAIVCSIKDTGIGMTPDELIQAQKPFVQADNMISRPHEGTGLGLPLCKNFIEMHGGHFDIVSTKGIGTIVTLTFPLSRSIMPN